MCLSKLESCFDLNHTVFFLKSYSRIGDKLYDFSVNVYGRDELINREIGDHFVIRLHLECEDQRTKKLVKGLLRSPVGCYFKIIKSSGFVLVLS